MSDWIITFRLLDQTVTVRGCATKSAALREGLRLAVRINPEIRGSDIIRCRPASESAAHARISTWPLRDFPPTPTGARLEREFGGKLDRWYDIDGRGPVVPDNGS